MEDKVEFVCIHSSDQSFEGAEAFGCGAHISALFLGVDDAVQHSFRFSQ